LLSWLQMKLGKNFMELSQGDKCGSLLSIR
jgi:hypothetical protein